MIDRIMGPADSVFAFLARMGRVAGGYRRHSRTRMKASYHRGWSRVRARILGYYPFGNKFFSNLLHYVRSGDFVEALLRDARDIDEYAFALGALAHYANDNTGHPEATNKAVPLIFPKLAKTSATTSRTSRRPSST